MLDEWHEQILTNQTSGHSIHCGKARQRQTVLLVWHTSPKVEKSATESKETKIIKEASTTLLKGKNEKTIGTLNVQTLNKDGKIPEVISSAEATKHDIICLQEHRHIHEDLVTKEQTHGKWKLITCSAWKNSVNASIGGIGMLLSTTAYNALGSVEKISPRIMVATFNGNPQTTVICCYSPTNVSEETETEKFYTDLSAVTRQVPKHNILIIGGDFNAHLGQKDGFTHAYHINTNRNGTMLKNFVPENNLLRLNIKF